MVVTSAFQMASIDVRSPVVGPCFVRGWAVVVDGWAVVLGGRLVVAPHRCAVL